MIQPPLAGATCVDPLGEGFQHRAVVVVEVLALKLARNHQRRSGIRREYRTLGVTLKQVFGDPEQNSLQKS